MTAPQGVAQACPECVAAGMCQRLGACDQVGPGFVEAKLRELERRDGQSEKRQERHEAA